MFKHMAAPTVWSTMAALKEVLDEVNEKGRVMSNDLEDVSGEVASLKGDTGTITALLEIYSD